MESHVVAISFIENSGRMFSSDVVRVEVVEYGESIAGAEMRGLRNRDIVAGVISTNLVSRNFSVGFECPMVTFFDRQRQFDGFELVFMVSASRWIIGVGFVYDPSTRRDPFVGIEDSVDYGVGVLPIHFFLADEFMESVDGRDALAEH